jgi:hypothetical protein
MILLYKIYDLKKLLRRISIELQDRRIEAELGRRLELQSQKHRNISTSKNIETFRQVKSYWRFDMAIVMVIWFLLGIIAGIRKYSH